MAKLSAHGYEVARIQHTASIGETEYMVHLSFRSDGHIMRRLVALNIHPTAPHHHDYGWKLYKKLPASVAKADRPDRLRAMAARAAAMLAGNGLIEHKQ